VAATLPPPLNELLEAWNAWDVERAVRLVHPDVEIRGLRAALENTTYRGREGCRRFFHDLEESWASISTEVREVDISGDRVAATLLLRLRARQTGIEFERAIAAMFELDGGLIRSWLTDFDPSHAYQAADVHSGGGA
jgi:ketosteroid isomerase-like protein